MHLKKIIIIMMLLLSSQAFAYDCTRYTEGTYSISNALVKTAYNTGSTDTPYTYTLTVSAGSSAYVCAIGSTNYICSTTANDLFGRCNAFTDYLPTTTDPFNNNKMSQSLNINTITTAPTCPDTWWYGYNSNSGAATCDLGYLHCLSPIGCCQNTDITYMGCEAPCNACEQDSDCTDPALVTSNTIPDCDYNGGHCKVCKTAPRACGPSDGYCPDNCYFDQDADCTTCRADCDGTIGHNEIAYPSALTTIPLNERLCICPMCFNDEVCKQIDSRRFCTSPGTVTAFCAYNLGSTASFVSYADNITIDGQTYDILLYERLGENRLLADIYHASGSDDNWNFSTVVYPRLVSGSYFNLGGNNYRILFTSGAGSQNTLDIFKVNFYTRLTYNIFPVCGNSVCEVCEDANNCLSYPPESCMSCPADCPYVTQGEIDTFNNIFPPKLYTFADVLSDTDLACQVKTQDRTSICNPLCVTHEFIDYNGCLFKRYAYSLPEYENGTIIGRDENVENIYFNSKDYDVYYSLDGGFLGTNNSLCTDDCECSNNYCNHDNEVTLREEGVDTTYGHCCPAGFTWSSEDAIADMYCKDGRVKDSLRNSFDDINSDGYIDSTQSFNAYGGLTTEGASKVTDYICVAGANNKLSCSEDYDPMCVYLIGSQNNYEPIQPNDVFQCRKVQEATQNLMSGMKCTIHTHAWAHAGCRERDIFTGCADQGFLYIFSDALYDNDFCITDNNFECTSSESISWIKGNSGYVLRSISYQEFCETPALVCEGSNYITNNAIGGTLEFTNCPQDAYAGTSIFSNGYNEYLDISVGYYCSLFGDNFDTIFNVNQGNLYGLTGNSADGTMQLDMSLYTPIQGQFGYSAGFFYTSSSSAVGLGDWGYVESDGSNMIRIRYPHMPMINRDTSERAYHMLWNYESCAQIFPNSVADCTGVTRKAGTVTDENGNPTHPFVGTYEQKIISSDNTQYVKSRAFCEDLFRQLPDYNWRTGSGIGPVTISSTTYSTSQVSNIISTSCIYWNDGFLDAYYSNTPASELSSVTTITPPMYQWGMQVTTTTPCIGEGCVPTTSSSYDLFDLDFIRNKDYCDPATGLVKPLQKCNDDYPTVIHGDDRRCD